MATEMPTLLPRRAVLTAITVTAVGLIYYPALSAGFFEDDFQWLVSRWGFHPADLLDLSQRSHFYRPMIELYFWAGVRLFDGSALVLHASTILLHLANVGIIARAASGLGWRPPFAWVAALLFGVQPSFVGGIAWVGALAEALTTCFGGLALLALIEWRSSGRRRWQAASLAALALALLTHESGVIFLPILVAADALLRRDRWSLTSSVAACWPFAMVTALYLLPNLTVNSRHYLVADGEYGIGTHMVRNVFEYIASMYVGERTLVWHAVVAVVLGAVIVKGRPQSRFAVAWMVLAILPFAPFTIANVSRYAYLPAVGLALLLADGLAWLDGHLAARRVARHAVIVGVLTALLAVRFGVFASKGVRDYVTRAETYSVLVGNLKRAHPALPPHGTIAMSPRLDARMAQRFVEAAVQWEYRDPSLRVVIDPRAPDELTVR
jgi:4-amino-4-deoxy-L-arabinose transferase-like glycosyltransferase